jgi:hypothetical protein
MQRVKLTTADGITTPTMYHGYTLKPWNECHEIYNELRSQRASDVSLPALTEPVTIIRDNGEALQGIIAEFNEKRVELRLPADSTRYEVKWKSVSFLYDAGGNSFEQQELRTLLVEYILPARMVLEFHSKQGEQFIPVAGILKVQTLHLPVAGTIMLTAAGACVDALILRSIRKDFEKLGERDDEL